MDVISEWVRKTIPSEFGPVALLGDVAELPCGDANEKIDADDGGTGVA